MKSITTLILATIFAFFLAACGEPPPSDAVIDNKLATSRYNAQSNADIFFSSQYPAGTSDATLGKPLRALMDSDSTITKSCVNGDGWASGNILFAGGQKLPIKCQTNGNGKGIAGCLTVADFGGKPYASEEKKCQNLDSLEKFK